MLRKKICIYFSHFSMSKVSLLHNTLFNTFWPGFCSSEANTNLLIQLRWRQTLLCLWCDQFLIQAWSWLINGYFFILTHEGLSQCVIVQFHSMDSVGTVILIMSSHPEILHFRSQVQRCTWRMQCTVVTVTEEICHDRIRPTRTFAAGIFAKNNVSKTPYSGFPRHLASRQLNLSSSSHVLLCRTQANSSHFPKLCQLYNR